MEQQQSTFKIGGLLLLAVAIMPWAVLWRGYVLYLLAGWFLPLEVTFQAAVGVSLLASALHILLEHPSGKKSSAEHFGDVVATFFGPLIVLVTGGLIRLVVF